MGSSILYQRLSMDDLKPDMLDRFNRHQVIAQCWLWVDGAWALRDTPHVRDWSINEKRHMAANDLPQVFGSGGAVFTAQDGVSLVGLSAVDGTLLDHGRYVTLVFCHVSNESRGQGIGRKLFAMAAAFAKGTGASRLYLSANPSRETQAFYHAMGCRRLAQAVQGPVTAEPGEIPMFLGL